MERESFEDPGTAAYMNERFVCVKVDREERPDVDALYMEAVQGMTGHGGWPLTAFLDPDGVPFYGGTYFPPEARHGLPSFSDGAGGRVRVVGRSGRDPRLGGADPRAARRRRAGRAVDRPPERRRRRRRHRELRMLADPPSRRLRGSAQVPARRRRSSCSWPGESATWSRRRWTRWPRGGIYDQIGGGFARYSVDAVWLVPHFEKMLYDNALLARAYLHGWQALGHERWRAVCERTLDWALREMRGTRGRLPFGARRRLGGRGGAVLRLDAGRGPRRRPRD